MEEIVNQIKFRYKNKPMFITENGKGCVSDINSSSYEYSISHANIFFSGYSSPDLQEKRVNVILNDVKRVKFHLEYLEFLAKSIRSALQSFRTLDLYI